MNTWKIAKFVGIKLTTSIWLHGKMAMAIRPVSVFELIYEKLTTFLLLHNKIKEYLYGYMETWKRKINEYMTK